MEHLDTILFIIVALVAIGLFVKFRVLPRSKSARRAADKIKNEIRNRTK